MRYSVIKMPNTHMVSIRKAVRASFSQLRYLTYKEFREALKKEMVATREATKESTAKKWPNSP